MRYSCHCGRPVSLYENYTLSDREFMFGVYNAQDDACWHKTHISNVPTCLPCNPPQAEAA